GRIHGVEDHDLRSPGEVVEAQEDHRLALLRRQGLEARDDATDADDLAVTPALEVDESTVRLPPQLLTHAVQRMLGDVETEALLLLPQELGLVELPLRDGRWLEEVDLALAGVEE